MNNPAYLVEGDLEQKFIQNACPTAAVQKINCNGETTSIEAIVKRVGTLGRLLHKRFSPLVVIFDRENRQETVAEIEKEFHEHMVHEKIDVPIIVGIPDENIETWILSDYEMFLQSAGLGESSPVGTFEGKNGKSVIKNMLPHGRSYVETIDGVTWLKAARPLFIKNSSASFARLFAKLTKFECWWLQQLQLPLQANEINGLNGSDSPTENRPPTAAG